MILFSTLVLIILLSDQRVLKKRNRTEYGLTTTPKIFDHPVSVDLIPMFLIAHEFVNVWTILWMPGQI